MNIVGVFKDYYQSGFKTKVPPIIFNFAPNCDYFSIKYNPSNNKEVLNFLKNEYAKIFQQDSFDYFYLNDFYYSQYKSDFQFGKVLNAFMITSLIITCMALFSLSIYATNKRIKEVAIRKVFGASVKKILFILTLDTLKSIFISGRLFDSDKVRYTPPKITDAMIINTRIPIFLLKILRGSLGWATTSK